MKPRVEGSGPATPRGGVALVLALLLGGLGTLGGCCSGNVCNSCDPSQPNPCDLCPCPNVAVENPVPPPDPIVIRFDEALRQGRMRKCQQQAAAKAAQQGR
jgi:hypothetical protein